MSMKATIRKVDSVIVVDLSGRITLGEGCTQLRELVRDQLSKGNKSILLNLADVSYIDSSGIGELVSAYTAVANQGGQLKLLKLTKKVSIFCRSPSFTPFSTSTMMKPRPSAVSRLRARALDAEFFQAVLERAEGHA